jgi:hypothetical protein
MTRLTMVRLSCFLLFISSLSLHAQTVTSFEGIDASQLSSPGFDVDPNGAVGTKQYMEWINVYYQAWDKNTLAPIWPTPQKGITPFVKNGTTNCTSISGDGVIIFDRLASRWVLAAHNSGSTNYYYCVAISSTDDLASPSLSWFTYAIPLDNILGTNASGKVYFPDWPKIATWPDAYYLGLDLEDISQGFQEVGSMACALDRAHMLVGAAARPPQCFGVPIPVTGSLFVAHSPEPADVEGTTPPPAGAPEYFVTLQNPVHDDVTTTSDSFNLWQFHVDWDTPANTTFTQTSVPVPAFTPGCYRVLNPANTICVPEPSTATTENFIDSVGDRMMFRLAYRNFGNYQSYLLSHTTQVGAGVGSQTGIRWYELRGNGVPAVFQSGTVNPDPSLYRFMPSLTQDKNGNAGVGYSVSSAATHPGIKAAWWNLPAQTDPTEILLFAGSGDLENTFHWGDYTSMTVDPLDGCTFWYVNEYLTQNQTGTSKGMWQTRISNFIVPGCGSADPGTLTLSPASLNWGTLAEGTSSAGIPVTVTNTGGSAAGISSIAVTGANASMFAETNNCPGSLGVGKTCTVKLSFSPAAIASYSASLTITDTANNSPQSAALTGSGVAPVTLNVGTLNFGPIVIGGNRVSNPVGLANHKNVALTGISIVANGPGFSQVNTCGTSIAARSTCTITVTFAPTVSGAASGNVVITDDALNSPQKIALTGTGRVAVSLNPATISFGTVSVGTPSAPKVVTLANNMAAALNISNMAFTGGHPLDYNETDTCGTSVAAGATCSISITFTPDGSGPRAATLNLTDNANNSPQLVRVSGTGN